MSHPSPEVLSLNLAWEFNSVLPGEFQRDRLFVAHKRFPVLGPRPDAGPNTQPLENKAREGHTELFKQFMDDESFRRWLTDTVFGLTYEGSEPRQ